MSDFYDNLEDNLGEKAEIGKAEFWNPDEGDVLAGELISVEQRQNKNYPGYSYDLVIKVQRPKKLAGEMKRVWASHFVLKEELERLMPKLGEPIGLQYHGKVKSQNSDRKYANWTVLAEARDQEFWLNMWKVYNAGSGTTSPPEVTKTGPDFDPF